LLKLWSTIMRFLYNVLGIWDCSLSVMVRSRRLNY